MRSIRIPLLERSSILDSFEFYSLELEDFCIFYARDSIFVLKSNLLILIPLRSILDSFEFYSLK